MERVTLLSSMLLLGLLLGRQSFAQDTEKAIFHVTSVHSEEAKDWCTTGKCSATKITVEGYADAKDNANSVEYILECVEVIVNDPSPHLTVVCSRVHAHNDYSVQIGPDYIFFGESPKSSKTEPMLAAYSIKLEKEVPKHKR